MRTQTVGYNGGTTWVGMQYFSSLAREQAQAPYSRVLTTGQPGKSLYGQLLFSMCNSTSDSLTSFRCLIVVAFSMRSSLTTLFYFLPTFNGSFLALSTIKHTIMFIRVFVYLFVYLPPECELFDAQLLEKHMPMNR